MSNIAIRASRWFTLTLVGAAASLAASPAIPAEVLCAGHWKKVASDGPPARNRHAMAYDAHRERIVVFGGLVEAGHVNLGDTWEWDGEQWTFAADTGPSPRSQTALAYDETRQRIVLFGGVGKAGKPYDDNDDTWEWDGTAWTDVTAADPDKRPSRRNGMGMVFDTQRHKEVMFGGGLTFCCEYGDTWTRDDGDWRRRAQAGEPGVRALYNSMAYDREHAVSVQINGPCDAPVTWAFDGSTWTAVAGAQFTPRYGPPLAYDSARHRVVLQGGESCNGLARPTDTWEWDGTDWQQVADGKPGDRTSHTLAYDRRRGEVVMFGGFHGSHAVMDETWVWKGPTYRCAVPMAGDINCDGVVDIDDRKIIDAGRGTPACAADDTRDLDGDGHITFADKTALEAICTFADCARGPGDTDKD
jgi:hypothetical protein